MISQPASSYNAFIHRDAPSFHDEEKFPGHPVQFLWLRVFVSIVSTAKRSQRTLLKSRIQ